MAQFSKNIWIPFSMFNQIGRGKGVLLIAKYPGTKHFTDPYWGWENDDGELARWPFIFPPTHFMRLDPPGE